MLCAVHDNNLQVAKHQQAASMFIFTAVFALLLPWKDLPDSQQACTERPASPNSPYKRSPDLQDAARYFQDVLMLSGEDDDIAAALDSCIADLKDARAMS